MQCKFEITINGYINSFNSQQELNEFISKNFVRIQAAIQSGNVKFSKEVNPKEDTLAKIDLIRKHNEDVTTTFDEMGNKLVNNGQITAKGYTGVTRFIESMKQEDTDKPLLTPFDVVSYKRTQTSKVQKELANDPANRALTPVELYRKAQLEVEGIIEGWKILSPLGTELHAVAQLYINDGVKDIDELLSRTPSITSAYLMQKYITYIDEIKQEMIRRSGDPEMTFISEFPVHDEASKIVGVIDIVGIDKDGNSYIGDFKTSYKSVNKWDRDKLDRSKYQLAFYQQLLKSKGIPVAELFVFPLHLKDVDLETGEINDIRRERTEQIKGTEPVRYMEKRLRTILPINESEFMNYKHSGKIASQMLSLFDISSATTVEETQKQIESFYQIRVKEEDGEKFFYDARSKKRVVLPDNALDAEDLIKATIEEEFLLKASDTENRIGRIKAMIESSEPNYEDLVMSGIQARKDLMRKAYARYCDGTWEIQRIRELETEGIITFKNKYKGTLEFVVDTDLILNSKRKFALGDTMLGKFYKNEAVAKSRIEPVPATEANLAALKVLMFLNANHSTLNAAGLSLGLIRVINTTTHGLGIVGIENDKLISQYRELTKKAGLEFNLDRIKKSSFEDLMYAQVVNILKDQNLDRDEMSMLEDIFKTYSLTDQPSRIAQLLDIQKQWIKTKGLDPADLDVSSPQGYVFSLLNATILDLKGIKVRFEEDINKLALNRSEILSTPFELEAIETIKAAQYPIKQAMQAMADTYVSVNSKLRNTFQDFYRYKNTNMLLGNHINAFDNLFERDSDGKITREFKFKNPDNPNSKLDPKEREFLQKILTIINNTLRPNTPEQELKDSGEWYNAPLLRAGAISRFHNGTSSDAVKNELDNMLNFHNLFAADQEENLRKSQQMLEAHGMFGASVNPEARQNLLTENKPSDFETNIEAIVSSLVYSDIRKKAYDQVLPVIYAVRVTSRLMNKGFINVPLDNMDRYIREYVKIAVFDEKILEKAHEKVAKPIQALKHGVSILQLGLSPLNLIKETMQGQFGNIVKLMAGQYGSKGASMASYKKALSYIIGEGPAFFKNVTVIEELNHQYGMANMDRHQLAEKMKLSKQGISNFQSRWLLWASGAPDYVNRMALFIAQMIEDGSFDAHKMENGELIYDWTKDKRFADYAAGRKGADYNAQRSLYLRLLEEYNNDNALTGGARLIEGDALPKAYTTKDQQSMKMFSDYIHGPYDHEGKIKLNHMLLGGLFIQFKTWLTAKKQQYTMAGDIYAVGSWEQSKDIDGNLEYIRRDEEGNIEITTDVTDEQYIVWKGRFMEGVFQSFMRIYGELKNSERSVKDVFEFIKQDETIKGNLKMLSYDLALFTIFSLIIKGMIDWEELKDDDAFMAAVLAAGVNSTSDLNPWANVKSALDPKALTATVNTVTKNAEDIFGAVVGDKSFIKLMRNSGLGRTIDSSFGLSNN